MTLQFIGVRVREILGDRLVVVTFRLFVVAFGVGLFEVLGVLLNGLFDTEWGRTYFDIF